LYSYYKYTQNQYDFNGLLGFFACCQRLVVRFRAGFGRESESTEKTGGSEAISLLNARQPA